MTVPPPRRKKPTSVDEIGRVLSIYDVLAEEIDRRITPRYVNGPANPRQIDGGPILVAGGPSGFDFIPGPVRFDILSVAERIAARTED